ncbi:MAG: nitrilase-related carbon-nitrogen hydrolase [Gemmatimonadota bacterium]|nr:nitrilase-related carbon-nitrogen hydrolase [Gemmatimonadota bacterium]
MIRNVTIAQFRPAKGDLEGTLDHAAATIAAAVAAEPAPDLVVFPETALTGYFLEGGVREVARPAGEVFQALAERAAAGPAVDVALGFYEMDAGHAYNSALYARLGPEPELVHVQRKVFLPTYGVFQEERFVESGSGIRAFDTSIGRVAILICEDAFHSISGTLAALDGAQLVLVLSASPARGAAPGVGVPTNVARWDMLGSGLASEHGIFVAVSQLVGFEGGKGFAGGSAAYTPRGERIVAGPLWEEALLPIHIDPERIADARTEEPLFADLERSWTRLLVNSPGAGIGRPAPDGPRR